MENKRKEYKRFRDIGIVILAVGALIIGLGQFLDGIGDFVTEQRNMLIFLLYAGLALLVVGQSVLAVLDEKLQDTVLKKGLIAGTVFFGIAAVLAIIAVTGIAPVEKSVLLWICLGFGGAGLILILNTLNMVSAFTLILQEKKGRRS